MAVFDRRMNMKQKYLCIVVIFLWVALSSCSAIRTEGTSDTLVETPTEVITLLTEAPLTPTEESSQEIPNPVTGGENATEEPTKESVVITHLTWPGTPKYNSNQWVVDCSTGDRNASGTSSLLSTTCDTWDEAHLERPFDSQNGTYFAAVDIVRIAMGTDQNWMYGKISLYQGAAGHIPADLSLWFEIDTDFDSRGEYLILATGVNTNDWTTDGVQVWWDQTGDVGGEQPHVPDGQAGDGYETLLFDGGQGEDPDLAWVRIDPEDAASVEFAFKPSFLPENQYFAWWAGSMLGAFDAGKMELVDRLDDHSTWNMDNTCGWIFNGKPSNKIVNICAFIVATATPMQNSSVDESSSSSPSTSPTCPPGEVWSWYPWGKKWMCLDPNPN